MPAINRPSVRYAQNFLADGRLVERLLDASTIGPDDTVYEIGPGRGIITERLARRCRRVVAIEKDPCLAARLQRQFASSPAVTVVGEDVLRYALPDAPYKVFANIPFNATSAIVIRLTMAARPPDDAYLVVQREAACKILGRPRESLYGLLLKPWFEPTLLHRFRFTDFSPPPNVEAVLLRLHKRGPPLISGQQRKAFRDFVVYCFGAWQPSVQLALRGILSGRQVSRLARDTRIDLDLAPSSLRLEQWLRLFAAFDTIGDTRARALIAGSERRLRDRQAGLDKVHRTRARRGVALHPRHPEGH